MRGEEGTGGRRLLRPYRWAALICAEGAACGGWGADRGWGDWGPPRAAPVPLRSLGGAGIAEGAGALSCACPGGGGSMESRMLYLDRC